MTITTNPSRDEYTSTAGQTVFNYTFKIYANTDLNVYVTPSGQSPDDSTDLTTDYVVDTGTIGDEAGGFITFNTPLNNGDAVTIVSAIPYDRTVDYQNNGDFLPETVNDDNDRQVSQIKQILEQTGRTLQFQESLQGASTLSLPDPVSQNFMRWKTDLTGLENVELVDGALVVGNGQLLIFPTVAALKASTSTLLVSGVNIETQGYYTLGDGGGAKYLIQTAAEFGGTPDEFGDHTLNNGNVAILQVNKATNAHHYGAVRDSTTNNNSALQAYADACVDKGLVFTLLSGGTQSLEYRITQPISFGSNVSVLGQGATSPRILCDDCSMFIYPLGSQGVKIQNIRGATSVRHTDTPNSHSAVEFPGDTSNRPYDNLIENCFFDGFFRPVKASWANEFRVLDNQLLNCGQALFVDGITVNSFFQRNNCSGNSTALRLGTGSETVEGWHITENTLVSFAGALDFLGASYCNITNNIFDFITGTTGVLLRDGTGLPSIGNRVKDNYIAFSSSASGSEGIRLFNSVASSSNRGSLVSGNEIFAYSGGTLDKGILVDGTEEDGARIFLNTISADSRDIDISGALDCIVRNNTMDGAGFFTTVRTEYDGNKGAIISSRDLLRRTFDGETFEYWRSAQPSSGTFVAGDIVWKTNPAIDGNDMVLNGWRRLTSGGTHVLGTDWARMYVSHVSPAA